MESKKTILVTNDDGIRAEGIKALIKGLEGICEIVTVAPELEQSATSHSITLDGPLRITKYSDSRFGVSGTPTDCVFLAVNSILASQPDLIVSGINHGPNMGEDVFYSGTVAAAIEGSLLGIPSIAVSVTSWEPRSFDPASSVARYLALRVLEKKEKNPVLWNVNIPPVQGEEIKGIRITKLGSRVYNDTILKETDPRGKEYYWIGGGKPGWNRDSDSDFAAISENYISITPLSIEMTDYKRIFDLKKWDLQWKKGSITE
ncbi:MAG: 5'/3'-nucleotidase SurE [Candidatus Krumholzibacteriota bacterium]|nr:5'/3'-nucleotidase SurE [Candidatus Krumholzibacteriota bacterium]